MAKSKISDERIIELIEQGLNNTEIARCLDTKQANIHHRLKELRRNHEPMPPAGEGQEFDLQQLDTVRIGIGVKRFRVTEISREGFAIREVMSDEEIRFSRRTPEVREFSKAEYLAGRTGIVKLEQIQPVKTYIDESLKRQKEESVEGMAVSRPKEAESAPERTKTSGAVSEPGKVEKPPENDYLSAIDQIVRICKRYGSDDRIRRTAADLAGMILAAGVEQELAGGDRIEEHK